MSRGRPSLSPEELAALRNQIGRPVPSALRTFIEKFFGPAFEAGVMNRKQAQFLTGGPFLTELYIVYKHLPRMGVDEGFLFLLQGEGRSLSLENGQMSLSVGDMEIKVLIAGRETSLDREGISRRASSIERIVWPRDTVSALLFTDELRAWYMNLDTMLPALAADAPRSISVGPTGVAKRRAALWKHEESEDRRSLWAALMLDELNAGGHRVLEGLIVPEGAIWMRPFIVENDPHKKNTQDRQLAKVMRRLDEALAVDRAPLVYESPPGWEPAAPGTQPTRDPMLEENALDRLGQRLSRGQRKVLELARQGATTSEIARKLELTPAAVRKALERIRKKAKKPSS